MESVNSLRGTSIYLVINNGKVMELFQGHCLSIIPTKKKQKKTKCINLLAMSTSHASIWNASMFGVEVEGKSGR
jgi:hypothetical protein